MIAAAAKLANFAAFTDAKADLLSMLAGQNQGRCYACKISKTDDGKPFLQVLEDGEALLIATEVPKGGAWLTENDGSTPVAWGADLTAALKSHIAALKCLELFAMEKDLAAWSIAPPSWPGASP